LEARLLIAYGLMTIIGVSSLTWVMIAHRRRTARRLRLRGIKTGQRH